MPGSLSKAFRVAASCLFATYSLSTMASNQPVRPFSAPDQWQLLSYSGIPSNSVSFSDSSMQIAVSSSASPIIFPLTSPLFIEHISLTASFEGHLEAGGQQQGAAGADDFMLRLGLVYEGDKTLNIFEYAVAPDWVQTLFDLAPDNTGVSYIDFKSVYSDPALAGKSRLHPESEYMHEHFITAQPDEGEALLLNITPDQDKRVLGIWLSCDGDDTGSNYTVNLKDLVLIPKQP